MYSLLIVSTLLIITNCTTKQPEPELKTENREINSSKDCPNGECFVNINEIYKKAPDLYDKLIEECEDRYFRTEDMDMDEDMLIFCLEQININKSKESK